MSTQKEKITVSSSGITSSCRSYVKPGEYMLLPRANRVEHHLPGFDNLNAQVLVAPPIGAHFVEHELLVKPRGGTTKDLTEELEQFFYVLEGTIDFEIDGISHRMDSGGFCWLPPDCTYHFKNPDEDISRVVWIRRRYVPIEGIPIPDPIISNEKDIPAKPVDTYMEQHLTPYENPAFDMGINLQVFDPGVYFSFVESHVMEHGLYMLYGSGIYWLNKDFMEVQKDDFIYMAPWCPQFFYATGWGPSAYLLYKDVNRDYTKRL
jgi:(S)-ureidoglycine aminohydrolase